MTQPNHPTAGEQVVDLYPAGAEWAHHHHGHVVVSQRVLLSVLGILMFFTLATVAAAQAEQWFSHTFDVVIPQWVNVAVALSIAAVKSTIVALYFMQLRYDNPINGVLVIFTLFVLAFFLGFTSIDLVGRDAIYDYKAKVFIEGGNGGAGGAFAVRAADDKKEQIPAGVSIAMVARTRVEKVIAEAVAAGAEIGTVEAQHLHEHRMEEIIELRRAGKPLPAELAAHVQVLLKGIESLEKAHKPLPAWLKHFEEEYNENPGPASGPDRSRVRTGITMPGLAPAHGEADKHAPPGGGGTAPAGEHKPAEPGKKGD